MCVGSFRNADARATLKKQPLCTVVSPVLLAFICCIIYQIGLSVEDASVQGADEDKDPDECGSSGRSRRACCSQDIANTNSSLFLVTDVALTTYVAMATGN
jgi:hypothetical protein